MCIAFTPPLLFSVIKWNHVSECLPEKETTVLIAGESRMWFAMLRENSSSECWANDLRIFPFKEFPFWTEKPSLPETIKKAFAYLDKSLVG